MMTRRWGTLIFACVVLPLASLLVPVNARGEPVATDAHDVAPSADPHQQFPNTIFRYRNKRGREVFTNIWSQVPTSERGRAKTVDLSHITLNPQLGAELDASMQHTFETLSHSPECTQVKREAEHWFKPIWDEYGHLIWLAGILLALLLATPFALRRVEAPVWARTLTKAIMMIAFVGVFMHTTVRAGKTYESMRKIAEPCERENWNAVAKRDETRDGRVKVLMDLQTMIRRAQTETDQDRLDAIDKLLTQ